MGKYTINYACGHGSFEKIIRGTLAYREDYIDHLESSIVCPECCKLMLDTTFLEVVETDQIDAIKKLLDMGANINTRSPFGETALSIAKRRENKNIVAFLKKHGAKE